MTYNPSSTVYSFIAETVPGTIPATGSLLKLDVVPGSSPTYVQDVIKSATLRSNRASAGALKIAGRVDGAVDVEFRRDPAIELLLSSALCGSWVETGTVGVNGDVLKAGNTDTSFTVEKWMKDGVTSGYRRFSGNQVTKWTLDCDAAGIAKSNFTFLGMGQTFGTTATSLTYAGPTFSFPLSGLDVTSVTVAGLTGVKFRALSLSVEHDRETHDTFGSATPIAIGTSGIRNITLNLQLYMSDLSASTAFTGSNAQVAVSITIGGVGTGYTITLPAANVSNPQDVEDNSKQICSLDFTAAYDNTAATDIQITRL